MRPVEILELYDFYRSAPDALRREMLRGSEYATISPGSFYFQEGASCPNVAFVGGGDVRVFKVSREGREITLYHVLEGETCLLTLNAALRRGPYPASAVAESPVEAALVPVERFRAWVDRLPALRAFVFGEMAGRISDLMVLIHDLVFRRMDQRLAVHLLRGFEALGPAAVLEVTHESIAGELGSAREVVSRLLKELQREGAVELGRGQIRLGDERILRRLARPHAAG